MTRITDTSVYAANAVLIDPILGALRAFRTGMDDYNVNAPDEDEAANAYADVSYRPPLRALERWQQPALTRDGAIGALKFALAEMEKSQDPETAQPMIRAALAYLEREGRQ